MIFGATGAGKTSSVLAQLVLGGLRKMRAGAIFFTVKPSDTEYYLRLCKLAGREKDVVLIGPSHEATYNIFDAELNRDTRGGGITNNIASLFLTLAELKGRNTGTAQSEGFWIDAMAQLLRNALEVLSIVNGTITIPDLFRLVSSAPKSLEQLRDATFRSNSYCFQLLDRADSLVLPENKRYDLDTALDYFIMQWPSLAVETRSSIEITFTSILDILNRSPVREIVGSNASSFHPRQLQDGAICIVDCPVKEYGDAGVLLQAAIKYGVQLSQERRDVRRNGRAVMMVTDEAHLLATKRHDALFQSTARSSRTIIVNCTQSISNYLAAFGGDSEPEVSSYIGNHQTKIFCQQSEVRTNEFAADLIGRSRQYFFNVSQSKGPYNEVTWLDLMFGQPTQQTTGMSEQLDYEVQPSAFSELLKGGPPHWRAQCIIHQGGRIFKYTGRSWTVAEFAQVR